MEKRIIITRIIIIIIIRIIRIITTTTPAHDGLGTCGTSLVSPKQSVLRISIRSTNSTGLTIMQRRPGATRMEKRVSSRKKRGISESQAQQQGTGGCRVKTKRRKKSNAAPVLSRQKMCVYHDGPSV